MVRTLFAGALGALMLVGLMTSARAEDEAQGTKIELAKGKLALVMDKAFKPQKPANFILDYEFSAPAVEGDERDCRLTVMGAGGTVDENVTRWAAQFVQSDGTTTKDKTKSEEKKIGGQTVHFVEMTGDYLDGPPVGAKVERKDYRMVAAIVVTEKLGKYFLKLYGPKASIDAHEKAFRDSIATLETK